jgi:hypothetical protein
MIYGGGIINSYCFFFLLLPEYCPEGNQTILIFGMVVAVQCLNFFLEINF